MDGRGKATIIHNIYGYLQYVQYYNLAVSDSQRLRQIVELFMDAARLLIELARKEPFSRLFELAWRSQIN